jgi:lambda family phage portal protein
MSTTEDMGILFEPKRVAVEALGLGSPAYPSIYDGEKFAGGFGPTQILWKDYWTLRQRSVQMFEQNIYARGIIRRLVTNVINTGLQLEVAPEEEIIGREEGSLDDWGEEIENRWRIWANTPGRCDVLQQRGFGRLQAMAYMEAMISGDVLAVLTQDRATGLPRVRQLDGQMVQTPVNMPRSGNRIEHGVEVDKLGRHVAYWIMQTTGKWKRLPAYGEKSGRKLAWLVYGTEKRDHETRGTPILSLLLQSLAEIDRYRDSVQRKATINSMLAMFIQKDEERMGTRPLTGAAVRRTSAPTVGPDNVIRNFNAQGHVPGMVFDELNVGEKPMAFGNTGTDEKFAEFEESIVQAMAWHMEIPPEIMRLAFSSNYSASQAAINEFKMYLNRVRTDFGESFCKPVYQEWLIAQALTGRVNAPEILQAWRDNSQYDIFGAWISSEWAGHIKPSTDVMKQANGYAILVDRGWMSNDLASKELTGTKFTKNIKKLRRENPMLAEVQELLMGPQRDAEQENALALQKVESKDNEKKPAQKPAQLADALGALIECKDIEIKYA